MDIFIKSFNRPYCLERCISSIYRYIIGQFSITVLDDGTQPEHINKIKNIFPDIKVVNSQSYYFKVEAIKKHVNKIQKYNLSTIPSDFWYQQIEKGTKIFLLLEDDNWLIDYIDLNEIEITIKKNNLSTLGIYWKGNEKFIKGRKKELTSNIEEIIPSLPKLSRIILFDRYRAKLILQYLDKTKLSSPLYRLGILTNEYDRLWPFYTIYLITASFFEKNYWLYLWKDSPKKVDEMFQLKRATEWFEKYKSRYGKTKKENARMSYISSATNDFIDIDFDVICFNHYMNKAWLSGEFDAMDNFPLDYNPMKIKEILETASDERCSYDNWIKWVERFKTQYKSIGIKVDY